MICTSISEENYNDVIEALKTADFAEVRLDAGEFTVEEIKKIFSCGKKLVATYRPGNVNETKRTGSLLAAVIAGASYVDVEVESSDHFKAEVVREARKKNCKVIVSYHNYDKTPERGELDEIIKWCRDSHADIVKIACMSNSMKDSARILSLYENDFPIIAIGMGDYGKITRVAGPVLGAPFTYASLSSGKETASGQITKDSLKQVYDLIGVSR